ncbi:pseudouridine synthase [Obba rivulosa]|uniref:Pseudouridine synthase n=1 Tax=Obba rivulosa TaxID=1052685 RepID=A0A8E2J3Z7_9APHY|nr:pseudouridine synthase [Obba rivulosa]
MASENAARETADAVQQRASKAAPGLKKIAPYWYPYTTMAKGRWLGREILEVVSTEFRDRSMEYYRYALESGVTTINGKVAKPDTVVRNGDRIENIVHRHEPPVTATPVKIIHHDKEREFIVVNKPGSIPVHASGRYFRNSLIEILKNDFGFEKVHPINRLDRLTSGMMILPLSALRAAEISKEFMAGTVRKEYVARSKGEFPEEEVICDQPLLTIDRQMGLNVVHPEGKPAKTIFKRLHYDANTDTSVIHCIPLTGRSHQIRVHLQYLGYPIANDPVYSEIKIWGENLGRGGVDTTPSDDRAAPVAPAQFSFEDGANPETISQGTPAGKSSLSTPDPLDEAVVEEAPARKLLPRETGHDIGMGSPVPLSADMVGIITRLRNMKDEDEDWSRWRDVVFRGRRMLSPCGVQSPLPPQNRRKRGGPVELLASNTTLVGHDANVGSTDAKPEPPQLTVEEALTKVEQFQADSYHASPTPQSPSVEPSSDSRKPMVANESVAGATPTADPSTPAESEGQLYCPECFLPLHPDPKPERLYIFLHALRYTTSLGCFETEMPEWAAEGWTWEK